MKFPKTTAAAILESMLLKSVAVVEVRETKGKLLVRYTCNGGNCCTFLSIKTFYNWEYAKRAEAAKNCKVLNALGDGTYLVRGSGGNEYIVNPLAEVEQEKCQCKDCYYREIYCKHQIALDSWLSNKESKINCAKNNFIKLVDNRINFS